MTRPTDGLVVDPASIRRLVVQAADIVAEVAQLPDLTGGSRDDRRWADVIAADAGRTWSALLDAVRAGNASAFTGRIRAVIAATVPLAKAPPGLERAADAVLDLTSALAGDFFTVFTPLFEDRDLRPSAVEQLHPILVALAASFPDHSAS